MATGRVPRLAADVPSGDETKLYRFPPASPQAPSAAECTPEQLVQLAAGAVGSTANLHALLGSPQHVRRICELLTGRSDPRIAELESEFEGCRLALDEERNAHQGSILDLEAAQDRAAELSGQLDYRLRLLEQVSCENVHLRHQVAGTMPASLRIALGRSGRAIPAGLSTDAETTVAAAAPAAQGGVR